MNKKQKSSKRSLEKAKRTRLEFYRIIEYLVSGGVYFWTGYLVFFVADSLLGWSLFAAKMVANLVGWTVNYLLQRFWVFRDPRLAKHKVEVTGRYLVITAVDFFLDYLIVYALQLAGITPYIGQFISAGFFTVWNYIWYKTWVFTSRIHRRHPKKTTTKTKRR